MDILQAIGYSLIFSAIIWIVAKRRFLLILAGLGIFDLFINFHPINVNIPFFRFFFSSNLSPFPFFPWSLFFILGVFSAKYLRKFNPSVFIFSIFLSLIQFFVSGYSFERIADIGKVLILLQLSQLYLNKIPPLMEKFMRASRESLFLYISHIMIVYGSVLSKGLSYYIGENLNFIEFFTLFLLMSIPLYIIAYFINLLRERNYSLFLLSKNSLYLIFLFEFFKRKW